MALKNTIGLADSLEHFEEWSWVHINLLLRDQLWYSFSLCGLTRPRFQNNSKSHILCKSWLVKSLEIVDKFESHIVTLNKHLLKTSPAYL